MLENKDYCDYETCVALKKLGYKEKTLAYYTSEGIFNWRRAYIYDVAIPDLAKSSNSNKELRKHVLDAVSLYEAQKWLREEKGMLVDSMVFADNSIDADGKVVDRWIYYSCAILNTSTAEFIRSYDHSDEYDTYEEALSEGLREAVKILKEK